MRGDSNCCPAARLDRQSAFIFPVDFVPGGRRNSGESERTHLNIYINHCAVNIYFMHF